MDRLSLVVAPEKKESPDYLDIYTRIFLEKVGEMQHEEGLPVTIAEVGLQLRKQVLFFGVRMFNLMKMKVEHEDQKLINSMFSVVDSLNVIIGTLTPRELQTVFPIDKKFDGERYGVKDYFTTMKELRSVGLDNPITIERVPGLCMDYQNWDIRMFAVNKLSVLDMLLRYQGEETVMEGFMKENDIPIQKSMTDENGTPFIYDPEKNTTYPIKKSRPRWARKATVYTSAG